MRTQTGPMQLAGDRWPGIFIRGVDTFLMRERCAQSSSLKRRRLRGEARDWARMQELAELLESVSRSRVSKSSYQAPPRPTGGDDAERN